MNRLDQISEQVRSTGKARIIGSCSRLGWLPPFEGAAISMAAHSGVIAHDVADQVVEVWAGTYVSELQSELRAKSQCLPLAHRLPEWASQSYGTVGGLLATNLPHALSFQCGGPRDWVIGMTIVRSDGTVAKSGSKAVKSVAGYDAHKLYIGSRGTLGVIASVIFRTFPLASLPGHSIELMSDDSPHYVSRSLPTEFDLLVRSSGRLVAKDPASCTLWSLDEPPMTAAGWIIGLGGYRLRTDRQAKFERRLAATLDPDSKFAPGWEK